MKHLNLIFLTRATCFISYESTWLQSPVVKRSDKLNIGCVTTGFYTVLGVISDIIRSLASYGLSQLTVKGTGKPGKSVQLTFTVTFPGCLFVLKTDVNDVFIQDKLTAEFTVTFCPRVETFNSNGQSGQYTPSQQNR